MSDLNLGSIQIPLNGATKTWAILAKRGAGKSYTGAVMAEEFYKAGIPFIVFDPIDVWWGLRFDKDGKNKGLPIVVFGLEHADITLDRDMGKQIAQAIVKENVSVIISTFGMPKVAQRHLITEFSEEILKINNIPRHIFIEEAHEFVPQRVFGGEGKVFSAVSNLVVMGRNRGIGVTLINQRAATINKDVLTQLDTLLAFRNVAPQDRQALRDWVEYHAAEGDFEEFMKSLPSLPTGEGWIWSPEFLEKFERIKIRERETFHPDRERLDTLFEMPKLEQTDVQDFINRFSYQNQVGTQQEPTLKEEKTILTTQRIRELEEENQALIDQHEQEITTKDTLIGELQQKNQKLESMLGTVKKIVEGQEFDVSTQVSSGIYNVSPVEKIKKDFLEKAKNRIISEIKELDNREKEILLFIETQQKGVNTTQVLDKALHLSATSGGNRTLVTTAFNHFQGLGIARYDKSHGLCYAGLKERIKSLVSDHGASEDEIEQVYNHILTEIDLE